MKYTKLFFNSLILFLPAILISAGFNNYNFESNVSKIEHNLKQTLSFKDVSEKNLVWIYFKDKGEDAADKLSYPGSFLTEKSIERRMKRIKSGDIFDLKDIPVNENYIREISDAGIQIRHKSRWFNAVSCLANKLQIENISGKDFVKEIALVQRYYKKNEEINNSGNDNPQNFQPDITTSINYGASLNQSIIINVPPVHDLGYTGNGILIASLDAGFDNLQHSCFNRMRQKGLRSYDFVNGDTIVANGTGRMGNGAHGTLTLSLVGGYTPDSLVSPAFDSKFILAKTENTDSETPLEEDNWVAAAEWADSLGADIITSSLGYLNFDPPYPSYTWQSMDGHTMLITRAADIAVGKGIVVVISSGNNGYNATHNTLDGPADAFNIVTVGAVTLDKVRASFSSIGPTVDGRIKPDVMALGVNNITARFGSGNGGFMNTSSGTSLSCPMVAGVCALVLNANPNLSPIQVRDILRVTSDSSSSPNNLRGWGIVNALAAVQKALNSNNINPTDYTLLQNYPNPFNPNTKISYKLRVTNYVSVKIYNTLGREAASLVNQIQSPGSHIINFSGANLSSGVYFYSLIVNGKLIDTKKMALVK